MIADRAYKWFHEGDFSTEKPATEDEVVVVDAGDFEEIIPDVNLKMRNNIKKLVSAVK